MKFHIFNLLICGVIFTLPQLRASEKNKGECGEISEKRMVLNLHLSPDKVIADATLKKIDSAHTLQEIMRYLLEDPIYKSCYSYAKPEISSAKLEDLARKLLARDSEYRPLELIALGEIEIFRNYTVGHLVAIHKMRQILYTDPQIKEKDQQSVGNGIIFSWLIRSTEIPVADIISKYLRTERPGNYMGDH